MTVRNRGLVGRVQIYNQLKAFGKYIACCNAKALSCWAAAMLGTQRREMPLALRPIDADAVPLEAP